MCGATGEIRLDGRTPDVAAVAAMAEAMTPRGDRLGIKPLYVTEDAHRVGFASSLPALRAAGGADNRNHPVVLGAELDG